MELKNRFMDEAKAAAFKERAATFGDADKGTKSFRKECLDRGFAVVFRSGVGRKETFDILDSKETLDIVNSESW